MTTSRPDLDPGRTTDPPARPPWWAEGGSEICLFCEQRYAYEMEVRCVDCDSPACPVCAVTERITAVVHRCPGCCHDEED